MSDYEIREYRPGDEHSLLTTFNLVFSADNPHFTPRTLSQWSWAFRQNPAGFRIFLALTNDQIVAQYAALPVRTNLLGRETTFAQIVDSLAHPDHRAGLKRPGLFVQTALPFFDAYGGPDKDLVHYGWPIETAWRIGKTFLHYEMVRIQYVLAREPGSGPTTLPPNITLIDRFDHQARWVYDRCVDQWGASSIRDAAYLNWRLHDNPYHRYEVLGARDSQGTLRGWAVYRFGDWILPDMGILVDWLVPDNEPAVGELLHEAFLARARADNARAVAAIFPEWSPWFTRFQDHDWKAHTSDYFMVARNFHPRYDMVWLRDHWWYQLLDTDLV